MGSGMSVGGHGRLFNSAKELVGGSLAVFVVALAHLFLIGDDITDLMM